MKPEDFDFIAAMLKDRSGLALSKDKTYLLESRLIPVARKAGLKGLDELVDTIRRARPEPLMRDVTEAMTTNESFFFRDTEPFANKIDKLSGNERTKCLREFTETYPTTEFIAFSAISKEGVTPVRKRLLGAPQK
jgi:chemotaxis methyl-accepting protein methylase